MRGAKIYDMDEDVVDVKRWTELANVRAYYKFFKQHEKLFEEEWSGKAWRSREGIRYDLVMLGGLQ